MEATCWLSPGPTSVPPQAGLCGLASGLLHWTSDFLCPAHPDPRGPGSCLPPREAGPAFLHCPYHTHNPRPLFPCLFSAQHFLSPRAMCSVTSCHLPLKWASVHFASHRILSAYSRCSINIWWTSNAECPVWTKHPTHFSLRESQWVHPAHIVQCQDLAHALPLGMRAPMSWATSEDPKKLQPRDNHSSLLFMHVAFRFITKSVITEKKCLNTLHGHLVLPWLTYINVNQSNYFQIFLMRSFKSADLEQCGGRGTDPPPCRTPTWNLWLPECFIAYCWPERTPCW